MPTKPPPNQPCCRIWSFGLHIGKVPLVIDLNEFAFSQDWAAKTELAFRTSIAASRRGSTASVFLRIEIAFFAC